MIAWTGLRHRYAQGPELSFDDLSLPTGQHLLLRGASGSGKSTLLAMLAGLMRPSSGQITVDGIALHTLTGRQCDAWRGAHLGFVPQRLQLSVGQAQRVALARALMRRPSLLLADEPSASLDDAATSQTLDLLLQAATEQGATLVVATHDARVVQRLGSLMVERVLT